MIETPRQKTAIHPPINGRTTGHRKTRTADWTSFASEADRIESAAEIGLVAAGIVVGRIAVAEIALVEDSYQQSPEIAFQTGTCGFVVLPFARVAYGLVVFALAVYIVETVGGMD